MFFHPMMIEHMMLNYCANDRFIYHIGTEISIDLGIKRFLSHLSDNGQILIDEPEMVSYLNYEEKIAHVIFYRSLSKLEFLEYKYQEKVDKNDLFSNK